MADPITTTPSTPEERRALLRKILERKLQQARQLPLSLGQEALWFLDRLDPGRPTYGFYPAVRLRGPLDLRALERALAEIIRRHDSMRTTFPEVDGTPVQRIATATGYTLPVLDLGDLPLDQREAKCERMVEERPPIDVLNGPITEVQVLRLADDDHVVMLRIHHIVFDGWSLGVLAQEVFSLYDAFRNGQPSPLPALDVQYSDFAVWQRKYLQGATLDRLRSYWRERLAGLAPLDLPTDAPRPAIRTSRGATLPFNLSRELTDAVLEFSRGERVTPFMTLLAGFQEVLHRYSGQTDFAVGTPTANRRQKTFEPLIGYFINVLVLRADVSGDPGFRQLVQRVRQTSLDAYEHQDLTLDKIVEAVHAPRDMSRHPLFQVMFVVQNNPRPRVHLPGLEVIPLGEMEAGRTAKFEITVQLRQTPDGFQGEINFNTDLFASDTIGRLVDHYPMVLADALADPDRPLSQLSLLSEAESKTILSDWNATRVDVSRTALVPQLFEAHAESNPQAIAVVGESERWTYGQLNERANQLAHLLQARGVGTEMPVAICLERTPELLAAILGVMKAGGAYVPLDPAYARDASERLDFILQDVDARVLISDSSVNPAEKNANLDVVLLDRDAAKIAACSNLNPVCSATPEHLAYVIYTSGSTGRPKGVMVTHGNLRNAYCGWEYAFGLSDGLNSHLQMASFGFDVFTGDLVRALCSGGKLVICRKEILLSAPDLFDLLRRESVDTAEFVPVVLRNLMQYLEASGQSLDFMRLVIVGSDAWYVEDHKRTRQVLGSQTRLVNSYGLTETTIDSSYFEGDVRELPDTGMVPIGRAFPNLRLYVLDKHQRPVSVGVTGELYIGGKGVARGYVNRPDLDEERFLRDPFVAAPDARMCRTGDRVRWRTDGQLDFLGRADDQVKIRGFRIEPGEIEEVLREHPLLSEAAVLARERTPGDLHLVAYVSARNDTDVTVAEMRRYLSGRLPDYMVPSLFVSLDEMPTTSSGKVDRQSLPEPDWRRSAMQDDYVAPRTDAERRLAEIWSEVLQVERVGANDNFFDLGGNSLMALRLNSQVRSVFSVELPLVALFASPTLAELAERIIEIQAQGTTPEAPPIRRVAFDGRAPLSFAQEQFWLVHQMFPGTPVLNLHATLPVRGPLDVATMRRTVNEIVRRHESLRTTFQVDDDGSPMQVVTPELNVDIPVEDLSGLPEEDREAEVRKSARSQASKPIDLGKLPLFNIRLLRMDADEHVLLLTTDHIIFDGWSLQVLVREVAETYDAFHAGRMSPAPTLQVHYPDFAIWQREYLRGELLESLLAYWRTKLAGVTSPPLPTDRSRQSKLPHVRGSCRLDVSADLKARLVRISRAQDITLHTLMLAAFNVLLQRYCGTDDIAVVAPVANRRRPETHGMVGAFVNTIVLRNDLSGSPTFRQLLSRIHASSLEAFEHEELPFGHVVEAVQPNHDPARFPLVQVMFNYLQQVANRRPGRRRELEFGDHQLDSEPANARLDLALEFVEEEHTLRGTLLYDGALFDTETMERMAEHFVMLLEAVVADPDQPISQLAMMNERERQQLLVDWNDTDRDYANDRCLQQLVESQVTRTPDAVAVVFEDQQLTYRELNARANQLAHYLTRYEIEPDVSVGVCLERSLDMVISLLAILKAGGAYLPLDPDYPSERLRFMVQDSRPAVVLTTKKLTAYAAASDVPVICLDEIGDELALEKHENPSCHNRQDDIAYVIYTSGSTGEPKGVRNTHRAICNRLLWMQDEFQLTAEDRVLQKTPFSFDVSVWEFFWPLMFGARLVVAQPEGHKDARYLIRLIVARQISTLHFVPSMLQLFLEDEQVSQCRSLKRVICSGEALPYQAVERFYSRLGAELHNLYGPTEAAVDVTHWPCCENQAQNVPIGKPIANVQCYLLDSHLNPVPSGIPGELHLGGVQLARDYLNRPELTSEKFIPNPFSNGLGTRLYKTGDLCRYLPDGNLQFLGRIDHQVKIRGNRVELGEIEERLRQHSAVRDVVVVVREEHTGEKRLVSYVVPRGEQPPTTSQWRAYLEQSLPEYMIPATFVSLESLPLSSSGKVNRLALPDVDGQRPELDVEYTAPRTELEQQLAEIWQQLLSVERVGIDDDFFELGGNSLLAFRLASRVHSELSIDLPLIRVMAAPTIANMAHMIEAILAGADPSTVTPIREVDWEAEVRLEPAIRVTDQLETPTARPARVLLTGATGFLGAYLLRELLQQTDAEIVCLVRASDGEKAQQKLAKNLELYELTGVSSSERVTAVCGNLSEPNLGLSGGEYRQMAESIDAIYHNGAQVSVVAPYPVLKPANVTGTREVLRLATQIKVKPVHFVSTISVYDAPVCQAKERIDETEPLPNVGELDSGYAQSKCVAENLVRTAGSRGLPIMIYRPGLITSDSHSGAATLSDYTAFLIRLCVDLGAAPSAVQGARMTPVDFVARSIIALAGSQQPQGETFHLLNSQSVPLQDVYRAIRAAGYDLQEVSSVDWMTRVIAHSSEANNDMLGAFSGFLRGAAMKAPAAEQKPKQTGNRIRSERTDKVLQQLSLRCPSVGVPELSDYIDFLRRKDFLSSPTANVRQPESSEAANSPGQRHRSLVPLRSGGSGTPLFVIHGLGGHVVTFMPLATQLAAERSVYGLQAQGLELGQQPHDRIEEMASVYADEIRAVQPTGPYLLAGWSMGGMVALEIAQRLRTAGEDVPIVILMDTHMTLDNRILDEIDDGSVMQAIAPRLGIPMRDLNRVPPDRRWDYISRKAQESHGSEAETIYRLAETCKAHLVASSQHVPRPYSGRAILLHVDKRRRLNSRWSTVCPDLHVETIPGNHYSMLSEPHVDVLAKRIMSFLTS